MPKRTRLKRSGSKARATRMNRVTTWDIEMIHGFERHVTKESWMKLWMKVDPEKSIHLAEHVWGKFESKNRSVIETFVVADLNVSRILTRMVTEWGQQFGKQKVRVDWTESGMDKYVSK